MTDYVFFGLLAGFLQLIGYVLYYTHVVRTEGKPNALTWFMFAYGTVILTLMELDTMIREAIALGNELLMWAVLALPITCSTGGVMVAAKIWWDNYKATKEWWPREWLIDWRDPDGKAFAADIGLTIAYLLLWVYTITGDDTTAVHKWWVIGFLLASNATTIPNFIPMLRQTFRSPHEEHPLPWLVWGIAYTILLYPTWMKVSEGVVMPTSWLPFVFDIAISWRELSISLTFDWVWHVSFVEMVALMSYPALNAFMHTLQGVAAFSLKLNNLRPRRAPVLTPA